MIRKIFISCSHKNKNWKDRLVSHFEGLEPEVRLSVWDDEHIRPGEEARRQIETALNESEAAILLISIDYLTSDFIQTTHIPRLLERKAAEGLTVFPLIVEPCTWGVLDWINKLVVFPKDGRPLSEREKHQIDIELATFTNKIAALFSAGEKIPLKTSDIAQKIVEFLMKKSVKNLDRNRKLLGLLKFLKLAELKNDFDSIYNHALVGYSVDAVRTEVVKLLAVSEVRQAFREGFADDWRNNQLETTVNHLLKTSKKLDIPAKIFPSFDKIKPEIESFKEVFQRFTHKSRSPGEIKQYNEFNRFMIQMMEEQQKKSFHYQAQQYLIRLKNAFQKEFLDNNHYIDLNGGIWREKEKKTVLYIPLDTFIHQWLRDDTRNFLVILGEYGIGKTTFLRHLAHHLAGHWLEPGMSAEAPDEKYRLPLLFPLRDFEKKMEPYIVDQFNKEGITDIDFPGFLQRIDNDELVILLDGFDEMTQEIDADEKARNFDKIRRLIDSSEKSKIILTVRQEYFQSAGDMKTVFRHREKANYQLVHLLPFDDDRIQQYLETHTNDPVYYWEQIKTVFDLRDLAKRPVLLQLIVDYLPKVIDEKGKNQPIVASDLYDKCIEGELRRKSSELVFIIPNKYRREILKELAVWMFDHDQLNFDTGSSEIHGLLKGYFQIDKEWEYEKYLNEFLTFSFLIREADYRYRISHKSFRDYLTACAFVREITSDKIQYFAKNRTTEEINRFIVEQVGQPGEKKESMEILLNLVLKSRIEDLTEKNQWQGTNAANILLKIDRGILKNRDLSRCRLSFVDFVDCDLTGTDFGEADLSNCKFNKTVLSARFKSTNTAKSSLNLFDTGLTDTAVLKEFRKLSVLSLGYNKLTDISALGELKNLDHLDLYHNQLTDISTLGELKNLTRLSLGDNQLTDISALGELKNLNSLELQDNQLTDISVLKELKNLEYLDIQNNPLAKDQVDALKDALPKLKEFMF